MMEVPSRSVRLAFLLTLVAALLSKAQSQTCIEQESCGECIQTPNCVWCEDVGFIGVRCELLTIPRCLNVTAPTGAITGTVPAGPDEATDPVRTDISLRTGSVGTQTFQVTITALRNLPLDLYILMDLSGSMKPDLDSVIRESTRLLEALQGITDNARVGFGSFNDKPILPFTVEAGDSFIDEFCTGQNMEETCPYAFVHRISMTDNITFFESEIGSSDVTISSDAPENGLEALAQVITCEEIIGWRNRSAEADDRGLNRVVLLITDDHFHYAGEGRLAGVPKPYTGKCFLETPDNPTDRVFYERYDVYDYPSVGQIAALLADFTVVPIFAVTPTTNVPECADDTICPVYQNLATFINQKTRASVALLGVDSNDIIDRLTEEIAEIISTIELTPVLPEGVDAEFEIVATCPAGASLTSDGTACTNITFEQKVIFNISVTLNNCNNILTNQPLVFPIQVDVNVIGYGGFQVFIDGICECPCEDNRIVNAPECSRTGDLVCGICECREPWCGPNCSIRRTDGPCINGLDGLECSGPLRGECNCSCECLNPPDPSLLTDVQAKLDMYDIQPVIFGDACECDNFECEIRNGIICSDRGVCCNRECICDFAGDSDDPLDRFVGVNCQCNVTVRDICVDPNNDTVACNGVGECRESCERCVCEPGYSGQYCEIIEIRLTCNPQAGQCIEYEKRKSSNNAGCPGRNNEVILVSSADLGTMTIAEIELLANMVLDSNNGEFVYEEPPCSHTDGEGCVHVYYLVSNENRYAILALNEESCPSGGSSGSSLGIEPWLLALILIIVLLVLGVVILLIIKLIFYLLDYIEVKRLEKEARNADFSKTQNPLYQSPHVKYDNVAYGRPT